MAMTHEQALRAGHRGGTNGWRRMSVQQRKRKMAHMRAARKPPRPPEQRMLEKARETPDGCWLFTGSRTLDGYGTIGFEKRGQTIRTHRLAWLLWKGLIPPGQQVLHRCDRPACVNPEHLFLGTQKENVQDMLRKGRAGNTRGERNGRAKLTWRGVEVIRAAPRKHGLHPQLAKRFGVGVSAIMRIRSKDSWRTP